MSVATQDSPFFTRLPREIRDSIYELAYVDHPRRPFLITSMQNWMDKERERRRKNNHTSLSTPPMPENPLQTMLVNQQFFQEAAEQWLAGTPIHCEDMPTLNYLCARSRPLLTNLRDLTCGWNGYRDMQFRLLKDCVRLRTLTLEVDESVFEAQFGDQLSCVHAFTSADFDQMEEVHDLAGLLQVRDLSLVSNVSVLAVNANEQLQWETNVLRLENSIHAERDRLRAQSAVEDDIEIHPDLDHWATADAGTATWDEVFPSEANGWTAGPDCFEFAEGCAEERRSGAVYLESNDNTSIRYGLHDDDARPRWRPSITKRLRNLNPINVLLSSVIALGLVVDGIALYKLLS